MKNFKYLFLTLIIGLVASCSDEDNIFSESPSVRTEKLLKEYKTVLTSSTTGWYTDYVPFEGGPTYKLYFKFNEDNTVTVKSDDPTSIYTDFLGTKGIGQIGMYKEQNTNYAVRLGQVPELVFTDHMLLSNLYIQYEGTFPGEYEFQIVSATKDKVILKTTYPKDDEYTTMELIPATAELLTSMDASYQEYLTNYTGLLESQAESFQLENEYFIFETPNGYGLIEIGKMSRVLRIAPISISLTGNVSLASDFEIVGFTYTSPTLLNLNTSVSIWDTDITEIDMTQVEPL